MKINKFKNLVLKFSGNAFIPTCLLIIMYCVFRQHLIALSYVNVIRYVLLFLGVLLVLTGLPYLGNIHLPNKHKIEELLNAGNFNEVLKQSLESIVTYTFSIFLCVYLLLKLDKVSIYYNYIVILLLGIFIGFKITERYKK